MAQVDYLCQVDIEKKVVIARFESRFDPAGKYPQFTKLTDGIRLCVQGIYNTSYGFGWIYESELNQIGMDQYIKGKKVRKLLIDHRPDLIKELNIKKNIGINIKAVTIHSHENLYWDCIINSNHKTYNCFVYLRARENNPSGCPECSKEKEENKIMLTPTEIKELEKDHIKNYVQTINTTQKGDALEIYITKILTESNLYDDVIRTGNTGDKIDIVITLKSGIKKGIQCKGMVNANSKGINTKGSKIPNTCNVDNSKLYEPDTLFVMANDDRTQFALEFYKNIKTTKLYLPFNNPTSKYKDIMYYNFETFFCKLIELIPKSVNYTGFFSAESTTKEYKSLLRFADFCKNKNLYLDRYLTSSNVIDCIINETIKIQAKYCSLPGSHDKNNIKKGNTYSISLVKGAGTFNGKYLKQPYSIDDDFDYLLVEVGGTIEEPEKYYGYFCFIPKQVLASLGYLKTNGTEGKKSAKVCPPNYPKDHWSKKYWVGPNDPLIFENRVRTVSI